MFLRTVLIKSNSQMETKIINSRGISKPKDSKDLAAWEFSFASKEDQKRILSDMSLSLKQRVLLLRFI